MSTPGQIEVSRSVLEHANGLVQWSFLLNGAAAAGLLTFLGNSIDKKGLFPHWEAFSTSVLCFGIGLLLAMAARFFTFLALNFFSQIKERTSKDNIEDIRIYLLVGDRAIICAITALSFFLAACIAFVIGVLCGRYAVFG